MERQQRCEHGGGGLCRQCEHVLKELLNALRVLEDGERLHRDQLVERPHPVWGGGPSANQPIDDGVDDGGAHKRMDPKKLKER